MPFISIDGPKITKEQKKILVKEITDIASKTYNIPEQAFSITIRENAPDNVGVGGQLLSER